MPSGAASVTAHPKGLQLQTCDPGADSGVTLNNRANDVLQIPAARSEFMLQAVQSLGVSVDKAFEFGDCTVRAIGFDDFAAADKAGSNGLPADVQRDIQSAVTGCRDKTGG
jgi:hypothetical protein